MPEDSEQGEGKGGEVVPLRIIRGGGKSLTPEPSADSEKPVESFPLEPEQAQRCIQLNENSRNLLVQVGELDTQILKISQRKIGFIKEYEEIQVALRAEAENAAEKKKGQPKLLLT